jgi:DNA topoisomerase-3
MILQQPVERAQMLKLLATGRTDLLTQFISKKGRRFKAYLVKTPLGKIGFEFEPRAPRKAPKAEGPQAAPAYAAGQKRALPAASKRPKPRAKPAPDASVKAPAKSRRKTA